MRVKPAHARGKVLVELEGKQPLFAKGVPSPFRLQKILVPIDFSVCSKKALLYAIPFARQFEAALTLLYVVQVNYVVGDLGAIDVAPLEAEMRQQGQERLTALVEEEVRDQVQAEVVVCTGLAVTEIVATAQSREIDLIIMATHGYTGLKHVLLGSTAENVLRHAPCPVLVVREQEREFVSAPLAS